MNIKKLDCYIKNYIFTHKQYRDEELCYEDGFVLLGAKALYEATGDKFYLDFVLKKVAPFITEAGDILGYPAMMEEIEPISKMGLYANNINELKIRNVSITGCDGDPFHVENVDQLIKE